MFFPIIEPYDTGFLQVSDLHRIFYAQYGNPDGIPIVWLHGGPGAGCSDNDTSYLDSNYYRIILLDQRGAGKSQPFCEMRENNTQNLISDLEKLRTHLNIEKWVVLGNSWGTLLALCYAIAYPQNILGLILRSLFTGTSSDSQHFWYGVRNIFPDAWQELNDFLPLSERSDLPASYYKRIMSNDVNINLPAIKAFTTFDIICAFFRVTEEVIKEGLENEVEMIGVAKIFIHYSHNSFFIEENYVMKNISKISHLPCFIVHGRYDGICRASVAYDLHYAWPGSILQLVNGGHTKHEPEIAKAMIEASIQIRGAIAF